MRPTIDQQREAYTRLLAAFPGKKVVVRVLDAGADKPLAFLNDAHEENPALGLRGLRALRASEDILREQLTALAAADAATRSQPGGRADLWVMAPMVSTVEETEYFTAIAREYGIKTAGVMVEVPSSALLADRVLEHRRLRLDRHQRPHPVHARRRPHCSDRWRPSRTPGIPRCSGSSARSAKPDERTASRSASAARRRPIRCWPSCSSGSAPRACRWRRRPWRTCARTCSCTPSTTRASSPRPPSPRRGGIRREAAAVAAATRSKENQQ